jgi:hypothetical protein
MLKVGNRLRDPRNRSQRTAVTEPPECAPEHKDIAVVILEQQDYWAFDSHLICG